MTNLTASDSIGLGHIMVRDLTNLSITLQSLLPEPKSTAPNPHRFPSLDSPVPEHFPPQQPPPTNNNLPPMTYPNPPNFPPIYTSPQSQPPTYTTYATPPNPPHVNPQNQPPTHTLYVSFPTNTYPLPTTTLVNTSNSPPPIQNSPTIQTYPIQHIQGAHIATPYAQHDSPVYAVEIQAFTNPISVKFQPEVDQYEEMDNDVKAKTDDVLVREIRDLNEAMRNLQTTRGNKSLEYEDLCVQPGIDLGIGYKPPKFDIFNGIDDPHTHLREYCDKLVGVGRY
ncbi:leucine-rich repeat extensin-like protein 1 [Solanum verrucosum]|uniref:leucine-rich repeat extensin-like protein 1 n=1 Tax=Solanum verrucosum TaxID=315347 RepID=UPI0020D1498C|nr:leucine-rich repeat extensin-like protein 1 [Solanum verrucosum]